MRRHLFLPLLAIIVTTLAQPSAALVIEAGQDFYQIASDQTSTIEFFNDPSLSGAGPIAFGGYPIDPYQLYATSIIIGRKQDAEVLNIYDSLSINIEITGFCLKSIAPVNGSDIFVVLGETPSTGVMNGIYFGWMEDRGNWGVYSLEATLHADVYIAPSGSPFLDYSSSIDVELDSYLDQGWFDLRTNQLPSTGSNFFSMGSLRLLGWSDDSSVDIWAVNTTVPEPASFVIMGLGAITLLRSRKAGK